MYSLHLIRKSLTDVMVLFKTAVEFSCVGFNFDFPAI